MFVWNTKIMYSQLGRNCALSLPALLDLFQDIATLHAHEMGSGLEYLYSIDRAWIMSRWRVRLGNLPRCGDDVAVRTRAYECRRALNRRAFALVDGDGQVLAQADSLWTLIDTKTGGPVNAADIVRSYLTPGEGPELGDLPRKVQLPEGAAAGQPFAITVDLLDTNHHVNNVRSVALAMRFLPQDFAFTALAVDYHHPLLPDMVVTPLWAPTPRGFAVALTAGGQTCVSAEFIQSFQEAPVVFSSLPFLFVFLPVFFLAYGLAPTRWKNALLFLGSVAFYGYGALETPLYIVLLLVTIGVNWLVGLRLAPGRRHRKLWLVLGLCYDFFWLLLFKYAGFFFDNGAALWNAATGDAVSRSWSLILPIGISFYTFQIVSYLIDVYWEKVAPTRSFVTLGAYLCMFPQLIAGPIVQYTQVADELQHRSTDLQSIDSGLRVFVLGLGSKVLLANLTGGLWTDVQAIGYDSISTPLAWMAAVAYSFQLYFDFYGYSLMAVGLGRIMGFDLPQNFRQPYQSVSMTEFWRRWHITLGSWFREYVYIPLGGNRGGSAKTVRNLLIVWLLTGFWHGASWNFVLWGLLLFVLLVIERAGLRAFFEKHRVVGHAYMFLLIPLSWMLFAITDFSQLGLFFTRMFPLDGSFAGPFPGDWLEPLKDYGLLLAAGVLFCTPLPARVWEKIEKTPLGPVILLAIFWGAVYCLYRGLNDPFLYFRF